MALSVSGVQEIAPKSKDQSGESMGTQHSFPGGIASKLSATRKHLIFSSLELLFLTPPRKLHHTGGRQIYDPRQSIHPSSTKGLNDAQDGSTTSPYFMFICPQTRCTERERVGAGEKGQDHRVDISVSAPALEHAWQPGSCPENHTKLHQEH